MLTVISLVITSREFETVMKLFCCDENFNALVQLACKLINVYLTKNNYK